MTVCGKVASFPTWLQCFMLLLFYSLCMQFSRLIASPARWLARLGPEDGIDSFWSFCFRKSCVCPWREGCFDPYWHSVAHHKWCLDFNDLLELAELAMFDFLEVQLRCNNVLVLFVWQSVAPDCLEWRRHHFVPVEVDSSWLLGVGHRGEGQHTDYYKFTSAIQSYF